MTKTEAARIVADDVLAWCYRNEAKPTRALLAGRMSESAHSFTASGAPSLLNLAGQTANPNTAWRMIRKLYV